MTNTTNMTDATTSLPRALKGLGNPHAAHPRVRGVVGADDSVRREGALAAWTRAGQEWPALAVHSRDVDHRALRPAGASEDHFLGMKRGVPKINDGVVPVLVAGTSKYPSTPH